MPKYDPRFWEVSVDPELLEELPDEPGNAIDERSGNKTRLRAEAIREFQILIRTRLTQRQTEIVEMYFFNGLTQQEIAESLGISQQVVSKHLFGVIRKGRRVGGAITKLRNAASDLGIDPSKWV